MSPRAGMERVPHFGVQFSLVDTNIENGSFEVLPSTQLLADPPLGGEYNDIIESGSHPHLTRINLNRGTLWARDPRALHRGTPNRSDGPRPDLVICYTLRWAAGLMTRPLWMGAREFEELSERGRKLFEKATILPDRAAA